ncbi:MAG: hypothetical protein ACK5LN_14210 [Propioniciclava sp.]
MTVPRREQPRRAQPRIVALAFATLGLAVVLTVVVANIRSLAPEGDLVESAALADITATPELLWDVDVISGSSGELTAVRALGDEYLLAVVAEQRALGGRNRGEDLPEHEVASADGRSPPGGSLTLLDVQTGESLWVHTWAGLGVERASMVWVLRADSGELVVAHARAGEIWEMVVILIAVPTGRITATQRYPDAVPVGSAFSTRPPRGAAQINRWRERLHGPGLYVDVGDLNDASPILSYRATDAPAGCVLTAHTAESLSEPLWSAIYPGCGFLSTASGFVGESRSYRFWNDPGYVMLRHLDSGEIPAWFTPDDGGPVKLIRLGDELVVGTLLPAGSWRVDRLDSRGRTRWHRELAQMPSAAGSGLLVVTEDDGAGSMLERLDVQTGRTRWRVPTLDSWLERYYLAATGVIVAGSQGMGGAVVLDADTGAVRTEVFSEVSWVGAGVLYGMRADSLAAWDLAGELLWVLPVAEYGYPAAVPGRFVLAERESGRITSWR